MPRLFKRELPYFEMALDARLCNYVLANEGLTAYERLQYRAMLLKVLRGMMTNLASQGK